MEEAFSKQHLQDREEIFELHLSLTRAMESHRAAQLRWEEEEASRLSFTLPDGATFDQRSQTRTEAWYTKAWFAFCKWVVVRGLAVPLEANAGELLPWQRHPLCADYFRCRGGPPGSPG